MKPVHLLASCVLIALPACQPDRKEQEQTAASWQAKHLVTVEGFAVPECVLPDPAKAVAYVSNIESEPDRYWENDEAGFLSTLSADHQLQALRWLDSTPETIIHSPKGMCLLDGVLYFTDNSRVMRVRQGRLERIAEGFEKANDLATDGERIWVSDTAASRIFALTPAEGSSEIKAPESINGITFGGGKMYGVSWDLHEIYELDPSGEKEPVPFGLAKHFVHLDGIEVLEDGSFVVSDFKGNAVYLIEADRKSVRKLIEIPSPADIGLDRDRGLLYVPQFTENKVSVYQLSR